MEGGVLGISDARSLVERELGERRSRRRRWGWREGGEWVSIN